MRRGLWLILLLVLSFLVQLPSPVHAVSPTKVQQCEGNGNSVTSVNCTLGSSVAAGNIIVVAFAGNFVGGGTTTVSGGGLTFTQQATEASGNPGAQVYSAPDPAGGALTVTASTTGSANYLMVVVYEVSGASNTASATAIGLCAFNCLTQDMTTTASIATAGTFAVVALFDGSGSGPNFNPTALFTSSNTGCPTTCDYQVLDTNALYGAEWSTSSAASTNFLMHPSGQGNVWVVAAATFEPAVVVSVIGACNFFQLQCWWYPLLFMGLYSVFILMVASRLNTSPRGKAHLFLSALTYGSLVAVIFGIMNIVFPLLMLILNTIIALRLRG